MAVKSDFEDKKPDSPFEFVGSVTIEAGTECHWKKVGEQNWRSFVATTTQTFMNGSKLGKFYYVLQDDRSIRTTRVVVNPRDSRTLEDAVKGNKPRAKKAKKNRRPQDRTMICSDCGLSQDIDRMELSRASRPRCSACGGPLNRPSQA